MSKVMLKADGSLASQSNQVPRFQTTERRRINDRTLVNWNLVDVRWMVLRTLDASRRWHLDCDPTLGLVKSATVEPAYVV
jgi:hypothetical protein